MEALPPLSIPMAKPLFPSPRLPDPDGLSRLAEEAVRQGMEGRAVKVGFWGSMSVDPSQVYVSRAQAQRAIQVLEAHCPSLKARRLEKKMGTDLPVARLTPSARKPGRF